MTKVVFTPFYLALRVCLVEEKEGRKKKDQTEGQERCFHSFRRLKLCAKVIYHMKQRQES